MTFNQRTTVRSLALVGGLLGGTVPLGGQERIADSKAAVHAKVEAFRQSNAIPGLAAAVGMDGQVVWAEGFGEADRTTGTSVTTDTRFRIGPISMSLTSALVGHLVEQHRLDLDADVHRYVPDFPKKRYRVTLRQLAGHLGGIRSYVGDEYLSSTPYGSVHAALQVFQDDTLLFEPGTRFSYSTFGWVLLSAAIEGATGEDFLASMQRNVVEPLHLTGTVPDRTDLAMPERATSYEVVDGEIRPTPPVDNSLKWAGAGFLSTPVDLVRFGVALCRGELLQPETVELLWTSLKTAEGVETGYGIGWMVGRDADERRVVSHTGSPVGARAILVVYPDDCTAVAITANLAGVQYGNLPQAIVERFRR